MKQFDIAAAVVMLNDLQKKGMIKEVERELWMRIQSGGDTKEEHGKYR